MTRTIYTSRAASLNLYVKPTPRTDAAWASDVVVMEANENDGRIYSASVGDGAYELFLRAGDDPDATDRVVGTYNEKVPTVSEIAAAVWNHVLTGASSAATIILAIASGVGTLLERIIGTLASGTHSPQSGDAYAKWGDKSGATIAADIASVKTDTGTTLPAAIAAIELPTLEGPYTRTVTVTDSVTSLPIQGATVSFSRAGHTESKAANSSGVASFTVVAETWTYAVAYNNYTGQTGTIAVSASGDTPIALVALASATPAEAPRTNVELPTEDQYGARKANVTVKFTFLSHAEGATITGTIVNTPAPKTSDADGICRVTLRRLANYRAEYTIPGDRTPKTVLFTTGNTGTDTIIDD